MRDLVESMYSWNPNALHVTATQHKITRDSTMRLFMKTSIINALVQKHRDARRMAGLRLVEIWVPDTRRQGFAEECRRQSRAIASSGKIDEQLERLMDETAAAVDGWT